MNDVEEARRDEEEKKLRAKDKRRMKKLTQMNLPLAIANVAAQNDPLMVRHTHTHTLPFETACIRLLCNRF